NVAYLDLVCPRNSSRWGIGNRCDGGDIVVLQDAVATDAEPPHELIPQAAPTCVLVQGRAAGEEDDTVLIALVLWSDHRVEIRIGVEVVEGVDGLEGGWRQGRSLVCAELRYAAVGQD